MTLVCAVILVFEQTVKDDVVFSLWPAFHFPMVLNNRGVSMETPLRAGLESDLAQHSLR
jgi:hypothetical protein